MFAINNASFPMRGNIYTNKANSSATKPGIRTLNNDTVSFKAHEKLFNQKLEELVKINTWDDELTGLVEVTSAGIDVKYQPEIKLRLQNIIDDPKTNIALKGFLKRVKNETIGSGGIEEL